MYIKFAESVEHGMIELSLLTENDEGKLVEVEPTHLMDEFDFIAAVTYKFLVQNTGEVMTAVMEEVNTALTEIVKDETP